jgi:hypothetical protein
MSNNSINHYSIIEAINELKKIGNIKIVDKLERILKHNELPKSELHDKKNDKSTSFYKVDLTNEELVEIKDLFLDLEVSTLTEEGEATSRTNHYVTLLNNWDSIYISNINSTD